MSEGAPGPHSNGSEAASAQPGPPPGPPPPPPTAPPPTMMTADAPGDGGGGVGGDRGTNGPGDGGGGAPEPHRPSSFNWGPRRRGSSGEGRRSSSWRRWSSCSSMGGVSVGDRGRRQSEGSGDREPRRPSSLGRWLRRRGSEGSDGRTQFDREMDRIAFSSVPVAEEEGGGGDGGVGGMLRLGRPRSCSDAAACRRCRDWTALEWRDLRRTCKIASARPGILLAALLTFAALTAAGLTAVFRADRHRRASMLNVDMEGAASMGHLTDDELFFSMLPLFTLEEVAKQNAALADLPARTAGAPPYAAGDGRPFRNVSGICDDGKYGAEYGRIAESVMDSTGMPGVLTSVQLAPSGVVCLVHPLDGAEAIGLDVVSDPDSAYYARRAMEDDGATLQGPTRLVRESDDDDDLFLVARHPIFVDDGDDGTGRLFWGFSTVVLNWSALEAKLGLYEFFQDRAMEFRLLGKSIRANGTAQVEEVVVIAESELAHSLSDGNSRSDTLQAFDSGWVLVMGYPTYSTPHWVIWGSILVVLFSLLSSLFITVILVAKLEHEKLLYRIMPRKVVHRLHRGETVIEKYDSATLCFFDIVSFTTISGGMTAVEVMDMLKVLYTEYDRIAERHNVFNVETIGDAYIVIGGGPERCSGEEGAQKVASFALDCMEATRNLHFQGGWQVSIRAGLASGVVVAGVVGTELVPKYTLFGDTVTLADSLEAGSEAMRVLCSDETRRLLRGSKTHAFDLELRTDGRELTCNDRPIERAYWVRGASKLSGRAGGLAGVRPADPDGDGGGKRPRAGAAEGAPAPPGGETDGADEFKNERGTASGADGGGGGMRRSSTGSAASGEKSAMRRGNSVENLFDLAYAASEGAAGRGGDAGGGAQGTSANDESTNDRRAKLSPDEKDPQDSTRCRRTERSSGLSSDPDDNDFPIESTDSSGFQDYWSGLAKTNDAWQDDQSVAEQENTQSKFTTCRRSFRSNASMRWRSFRRLCRIAVAHRRILLVTAIAFAVLCGAGLATVLVFAGNYEADRRELAMQKAVDADRFLSVELQKSLLPLFAVSELVKDLDFLFGDLPDLIDPLPLLEGRPFRNVTGVCDDPDILKPFNEMAASVKESSEMNKILVNIQLAPYGVLCLTHPLNNTEDFENGEFLDTSGALGLDLLNHPTRKGVSQDAIRENRITIQGPIPLVQGNQSVVDEAIIARYPIFNPDHTIIIEGKAYPYWGLSVALMDWDKLQKKFGLTKFFTKDGMEFTMTRTDIVQANNETTMRVVVIAESEKSTILHERNSVSVPLGSGDNGWVLTVGYESGFSPPWKIWGCILVIVGSLLLSTLLLMVIVTTKEHELLLYRMMPQGAIDKLRRGETVVDRDALATVFFSYILGFTTLSGQMKPTEFMIMLNQIYEAFDRLTLKHQVSKVETIGACYIVTAPGPDRCVGREGVDRVALFALDAMDFVRNYRYRGMKIFIRAGLASGPIVSGVIGAALPKYTIFGDTVNFASRMASTSKSMKVQCSEKTQMLLQNSLEFTFDTKERTEAGQRGIMVKGKGLKYTWWLNYAEGRHNGGNTEINGIAAVEVNEAEEQDIASITNPSGRPGRRVSLSDKDPIIVLNGP